MYSVTCVPTGRVYVGSSTQPARRFTQHLASPPPRMRADVQRHQPAREHFKLELLQECSSVRAAERCEMAEIHRLNTTGPGGYNVLAGAARDSTKKLAIIAHSRKKRRARGGAGL